MSIFSEKIDFKHSVPDRQVFMSTDCSNLLNKMRDMFSKFLLTMKKYSLKCFDLKYFNYLCNM